MEKRMIDTISYFVVHMYISGILFLTTTYIYFKTSVIQINKKYKSWVTISIGCAIISVAYALFYMVNVSLAQIISYIYPSVFYILFERKQVKTKWLICFFASCFTRVLQQLVFLLFSFIVAIINPKRVLFSLIPIYAIVFLCAFSLLKTKRLKKGFQFFQNESKLGIGLFIAGIMFFLQGIIYSYDYYEESATMIFVVFSALYISGFGLYLWIRRSITAHYRERLQLKSEEHFKELLKEKELENAKLTQSNELLAKVVHRDNHLMASLDISINNYFESGDKEFKDDLLREIQTLAKERGELIENEQRDSKLLPTTGNLLTDGAINDLYIKAVAHGIDFNLTVSKTVDAIIGKCISQTDLQTLLCDHIKDAIIAVDAAENDKGKIMVDFSVKNENYQITVFDSGVDFEIDTLAKLGKERVTTHADNGGSGIGFMTTFETLRKAYASLMITEFAHKTPFSKSVSIIFDGENSFIIQSYRSDILNTAINRDDVVII